VTILHLLPSLGYTAAGRQVSLIASLLGKNNHVAALGGDGPFAGPLRSAGVPVLVLGRGRRFDPASWWRLQRRMPTLRAAGLLRAWGKPPFRLVVSEPLRGGHVNALDRRLIRSADAVIAGYPAEADALRRLGVAAERIRELPPAVASPSDSPPLDLPLPPGSKVVMCVGALTPPHGFRDAVWAADLLRYPVDDLRLVIVGDGDHTRLNRFALGINPAGGRVFFLPARPDAAALLGRADVVWVPSRSTCGRQVVLEAQAAGRPVVASALPALAALVADGRTGLLTKPGDPLDRVRRTRMLFDDTALAERIGTAARQAVAGFTPADAAEKYAGLYDSIRET
jgi:glycosyltransferase involved in cell wall biosynthesis